MSESLDGVSVAATRQNAFEALTDGSAAAPAPSVIDAPASTVRARVMVVLGSFSEARLSHDAAAARGCGLPSVATLVGVCPITVPTSDAMKRASHALRCIMFVLPRFRVRLRIVNLDGPGGTAVSASPFGAKIGPHEAHTISPAGSRR